MPNHFRKSLHKLGTQVFIIKFLEKCDFCSEVLVLPFMFMFTVH